MKKIRTLVSMLAAAAVLLLFPGTTALEAEAAEPTTYAVKYLESEGDWRFQSGTSTFNEDEAHRELYYLIQDLKAGDAVVVYNDSDNVPELNLGTTALGNLTVVSAKTFTVIYSGDITDFFALADTQFSVNANVTNASVYDGVICNFNKNVGTLNYYIDGNEVNAVIGCSGTVGHLYGYGVDDETVWYNYYNFKADTLRFYDGGFQTPAENYSTTPSQTTTQQPTTSTGSASSSNEYDEVPKTGDSFLALWLVCGAALCACGSCYFAKKAR